MQNSGPGLLSLQGFAYIGGLGNANIGTQQLFATTTYHYADNLTVSRGRHMMKMGANILREQMNFFWRRLMRINKAVLKVVFLVSVAGAAFADDPKRT